MRTAVPLVALLLAGTATAADVPVRITAARVGLPPAGATVGPVAKFGVWAPVEVDLELLAGLSEPCELVIEAPDADGVVTVLKVPTDLKNYTPGSFTESGYVRPTGGEVVITARGASGAALSEPFRIRSVPLQPPSTYVVLSLGSALPGGTVSGFELPRPADAPADGPLRNGRVLLANGTNLMPDQWFGYDAADLVVLSTSEEGFVDRITSNGRLKPLTEWVRRGGRLVVSVGANADLVTQSELLKELLPGALGPTRTPSQLPLAWAARETSQSTVVTGLLTARGQPLQVVSPAAGPGRRVVIPPASRQGAGVEPVAVQVAYGLGKVTVIGFDLDRPPFSDTFNQRAEFWDWVLREGGASRASVGAEGRPPGGPEDEDEVSAAVRTHLDTFDGVPVVSFGGVGLLIALYALLVAPVEFFLVRRVFRRPSLTWVTLPLLAALVGGAAYWSASAAKGRDLRVNKIDVVDVMAGGAGRGPQVFGTTHFTLFGPRTETFTLGVAPGAGWATADRPPLVGWAGGPRGVRPGLLRRKYEYHTDGQALADRLDGVPVQVWATKGFTAHWSGVGDLAESRLEHPPADPTAAVGTFVNRVPVDLTECVALYAGQAFPLGTLLSGQEVRLVLDKGQPAARYFQDNARLAELLGTAPGGQGAVRTAGRGLPLAGLLFHEAALRNDEGVIPRNASARRLDQSWRLAGDNRDEVIILGRGLYRPGERVVDLDDLTSNPSSPTRLRVEGRSGPDVLRQETYVRIYLPVKSTTP